LQLRLVSNEGINEGINFADELVAEIRNYLPSLIDEVQIYRTNSFSGSLSLEGEELKSDVSFLAKLGVEQFHARLGVLPHDEECFSYFTKSVR